MKDREKRKAARISDATDAPESFLRYIATHYPVLFDHIDEPRAKTAYEQRVLDAMKRIGKHGATVRELKQRVRGIRNKSNDEVEALVLSVVDSDSLKISKTRNNTVRFFYVDA